MTEDTASLIITGSDGIPKRSRRPLPLDLIRAWALLPIEERCAHAHGEIERRDAMRLGSTG